jgi:membrane protein involved in colicin uptake
LAFGKASVKAFAEDEKAAAALTQTLKNLGLGFANTGIEDFIEKMSLSTGVADDQLRPAMQKLLQTNLDVAKSQKLIGLALDISAAGFGDVVSVSNTLSQAMVGNVKGLKQFNLGITQAELSTMSFDQLMEKLTKTFNGQAAAAADTYAGKINILKNAAGEAQESIGKGLIDALMKVGNNKDMQGLVDDILLAGEGIGYLITGIGDLVKVIGSIPGFGFEGVGKNAPMPFTLNPLAILAQKAYKDQLSEIYKLEDKRIKNALKNKWIIGAAVNPTQDTILTREEAAAGMTPSQKRKIIADKKAAADAAKARAAELNRLKALSAAKIKADKAAAANASKLAKSQSIFNLEKIQIEAALKGKITEEEKTRLLLMRAILEEDVATAEALEKKLADIQKKNAQIAADLAIIAATKDPFATWAGSLSLALAALGKVGLGISAISGTMIPGVTYNPGQNPDRNYDEKVKAAEKAAADKAAADKAAADKAAADKEAADRAAAIKPTFEPDDTIDDILAKVENVAEAAAEAAQAAAASVKESQTTVDALAASATNGSSAAGTTYNPSQNPDRNYDSGYMTPPVTVNVNVEGSVISQNEMTKIVADALIVADTEGLSTRRPGAIGFRAE